MSRENRVMSQHIIQRALLERFANSDGKIIIHRFDGNRFVKSYPSYPRNVACADNYYDVDPYSETSLAKSSSISGSCFSLMVLTFTLKSAGLPLSSSA